MRFMSPLRTSFSGIFEPIKRVVVAAGAPCHVHPRGGAAVVLSGGFLCCTEASRTDGTGGAASQDGDEGAEGGEAGRDNAHAGFGGRPDGGVGVIP